MILLVSRGAQTQASSGIQWSFWLDPPSPEVGQPFSLNIYPSGYDGYPLSGNLTVTQPDPPVVEVKSQSGYGSWTLTPLENGKFTVHSTVAFETWQCPPGVTPTLPPGCPGYYYASSPDFSIDIGAAQQDADADGCPNASEQQTSIGSETSGGQRNFLNGNDYFNPTHDGLNRIDDIVLVLGQYFIDSEDVGYNPDTDRTLVGPNAWNLGPPNGLQRIDDIVNILKQYFHDCS